MFVNIEPSQIDFLDLVAMIQQKHLRASVDAQVFFCCIGLWVKQKNITEFKMPLFEFAF